MNRKMSWMVGLSAMGLAMVGWMLPRRNKTPMQKMMNWTNQSMRWAKASGIPQMLMKRGMRKMKGIAK